VGLALGVTWLGLAFGYYSRYPIGFYVTTIAFGAYLVASAAPAVLGRNPKAVGA
jgi:zinc/manganese transport system permease protein